LPAASASSAASYSSITSSKCSTDRRNESSKGASAPVISLTRSSSLSRTRTAIRALICCHVRATLTLVLLGAVGTLFVAGWVFVPVWLRRGSGSWRDAKAARDLGSA
jgi:hypothetical protein